MDELRGRFRVLAVNRCMQGEQRQLLKPSEVAVQLGVSRTWLYVAAKTGRIPRSASEGGRGRSEQRGQSPRRRRTRRRRAHGARGTFECGAGYEARTAPAVSTSAKQCSRMDLLQTL